VQRGTEKREWHAKKKRLEVSRKPAEVCNIGAWDMYYFEMGVVSIFATCARPEINLGDRGV
jgi:hypothetical protein